MTAEIRPDIQPSRSEVTTALEAGVSIARQVRGVVSGLSPAIFTEAVLVKAMDVLPTVKWKSQREKSILSSLKGLQNGQSHPSEPTMLRFVHRLLIGEPMLAEPSEQTNNISHESVTEPTNPLSQMETTALDISPGVRSFELKGQKELDEAKKRVRRILERLKHEYGITGDLSRDELLQKGLQFPKHANPLNEEYISDAISDFLIAPTVETKDKDGAQIFAFDEIVNYMALRESGKAKAIHDYKKVIQEQESIELNPQTVGGVSYDNPFNEPLQYIYLHKTITQEVIKEKNNSPAQTTETRAQKPSLQDLLVIEKRLIQTSSDQTTRLNKIESLLSGDITDEEYDRLREEHIVQQCELAITLTRLAGCQFDIWNEQVTTDNQRRYLNTEDQAIALRQKISIDAPKGYTYTGDMTEEEE